MKRKPHDTTHGEVLGRVRRIAGQVQGVGRMIEEGRYCIDIVTQVQAARCALRAVELAILRKHMTHCVRDAFDSGTPRAASRKIEELLQVMKRELG